MGFSQCLNHLFKFVAICSRFGSLANKLHQKKRTEVAFREACTAIEACGSVQIESAPKLLQTSMFVARAQRRESIRVMEPDSNLADYSG